MTTTSEQPAKTRVGNFNVGGINHLALVCRDMQQTVDFYEGLLGFPLVKTIELPGQMGQHFFFDIGNGDCLAFFNFPNAPEPAPGVASPDPNTFFDPSAELVTAIASMNHVAFDVDPNEIEEMRDRLIEAGVRCTPILNHDDSESRDRAGESSRRLCALGVLLRSRRDHARVCGLDPGDAAR